ncbi:hypothetical protein [Sphingobacterium sp. BIGb0116]|uniref:hypothetical protein n=1 Tax=Sphingobacterium sp. BIGb0116 TaxID=2940619 RepID=UPI002168A899|nr:hypothetical protein [Sphingobacterium sp. BIGb0116]MCS4167740.1 hypothetical protein [Sphingobacterium sp. BIGb0116]
MKIHHLIRSSLLFLLLNCMTLMAVGQEILYVFPDSVERILEQHLSKYSLNNDKERVYLDLAGNDEFYRLTIGTYFVDRDDDLTRWIKASNRLGLVNTKKYPLLIDVDFDFGAPEETALGTFGKREGKVKRTRVLMHGFSVKFTKNGAILKE